MGSRLFGDELFREQNSCASASAIDFCVSLFENCTCRDPRGCCLPLCPYLCICVCVSTQVCKSDTASDGCSVHGNGARCVRALESVHVPRRAADRGEHEVLEGHWGRQAIERCGEKKPEGLDRPSGPERPEGPGCIGVHPQFRPWREDRIPHGARGLWGQGASQCIGERPDGPWRPERPERHEVPEKSALCRTTNLLSDGCTTWSCECMHVHTGACVCVPTSACAKAREDSFVDVYELCCACQVLRVCVCDCQGYVGRSPL